MDKTGISARYARMRMAGTILGCASLLLSSGAFAQGQANPSVGSRSEQPQTHNEGLLAQAFDYTSDNSYLRIGVLHFQYYGTSSDLRVENATGLATAVFPPGESSLPNTGSSVSNLTTLGVTYGLYLPRTGHHLAMEITLSPPLKLDFQVDGDAVDKSLAPTANVGGATVPTGLQPLGRKIGTFKALPPNLTLVYRPWVDTMIQPYVGIGAMYLYTYDTKIQNKVLNQVKTSHLYLSKPVACVGQLGADFNLPQNMFVSADVKYVGCATVKARITDVQAYSPTLNKTIDIGAVNSSNHFQAVLYQLSFGMHF